MADLQSLLGEAYKDGMTIEEIQTALADKDLVDSKTIPTGIDKKVFDKTASELATLKKQLKEKMTEEEQRVETQKEKDEELKLLKTEKCKLLMEKELAAAGLSKEQSESLISTYSTDDADKALEFAQNIIKFSTDYKKTTEQQIKESLLADMQKPNSGTGTGDVNKEMLQKQYLQAQESGDMVSMVAIANQAAELKIQL